MHFREDGGGRGFRHWKWQRLAPSHCLWNALMNFTPFPVITNKQEVLPQGCLWHAVRSEHPLHLQSGYRWEQRLVLIVHLFKANADWSRPLPSVSASTKHWRFQAPLLVSLLAVTETITEKQCQHYLCVRCSARNSVPCQLLSSVHPCSFNSHLFSISVTRRWSLSKYNLDRSQARHMTFHSHTIISPTCVAIQRFIEAATFFYLIKRLKAIFEPNVTFMDQPQIANKNGVSKR